MYPVIHGYINEFISGYVHMDGKPEFIAAC